MKNNEDQFHQDDIGEDDEKRRQDYGGGGGAANSRGAASRSHARVTGNDTDDESEDSGLEGSWQKVVKRATSESAVDELMQRDRVDQSLGEPAHHEAAEVRGNREQRK